MKNRIIASFTSLLITLAAHAQDTLRLNGPWKVQPAQSQATAPDSSRWGSITATDWRRITTGKNKAWADTPQDKVNSLWYEQQVNVPADWQSQNVIADFRRIEGDAVIFLNHQRVGELLRPGGEINLSPFLRYGQTNTLRVFITRDYNGISRGFTEDPLRYQSRHGSGNIIPLSDWPMGITAPVTIIARAPQAITDVFCIPSFRNKSLTLEVEVNAKNITGTYDLQAEIIDQHHTRVLTLSSKALQLVNGKQVYRVTANWQNPICWELDSPYLYQAKVVLMQDGKTLCRYPDVTFGFREIWTAGNQLFMNGHLSRWRLTDVYGVNQYGLSLYRLIGYNVGQFQPHHKLWWLNDAETPLLNEDMLNEMDRTGMGCTVPGPSVSVIRDKLLHDPKLQADYQQEAAYFTRHYRNHPSILAWVIAMNSANPKSNIDPARMGKRDSVYSTQGKVIDLACTIVKKEDPTRLVFAHADGSVGDISSANVYLNFVPLQEREEWPMAWAKEGNMPYSAVEFGPPYWNNFWKGKQFLLTEYLSMYLGDAAYATEGENGLRQTIAKSNAAGSATWEQMDFQQYPGFWRFQELFTRNTNRAWRTWGVNGGWLYWLLEGYGNPNGEKLKSFTQRYKSLTAPLTGKPAWANPRYDIFKEANQPLLVYLAGSPVHTDKTHTFFAGETFEKQVAVVWDGPHKIAPQAKWMLKQGDKVFQQGSMSLAVNGGEIKLFPLSLKAPQVTTRTDMQLVLTVAGAGNDTFLVTVFPRPAAAAVKAPVLLYDPAGKSAASLKQLGIQYSAWEKGSHISPDAVLVIGREALQPGDTLPYTEKDVAAGLRVVILEQQPTVWEGMGFETIESMPRYTFIRDRESPLLAGLQPADMINWRGSPDLLPEGKQAKSYDTQHAPKWTNRHAVASVALKTPEVAGFTPILQTEFDMAYTPLLEWRYGKGKVTFCSLDLTGRVGADPAATLLAKNLFTSQPPSLPGLRDVYYTGDSTGRQLLLNAGISFHDGPATGNAIWVVGPDQTAIPPQINTFVAAGGIAFYLPQKQSLLAGQGLNTAAKTMIQAHPGKGTSLLRAIGPNLLRWRDTLQVTAFTSSPLLDGLLSEVNTGKGKSIYLQLTPGQLAQRYTAAPEKQEAIQLSVIRIHQLIAQLLTNMGAAPSPAMARKLCKVNRPLSFRTLSSWKVLGPYTASGGAKALATTFPGQEDAIAGAENPNLTYKTDEGKVLDWRQTADAGHNGFVDLSKVFGGKDDNAVAYVTKSVNSPSAQKAILRMGIDYWMEVWLNGKSILRVDANHQKRENEFILPVALSAGENMLTIKVVSGKGGFGFWANIAYPEAGEAQSNASDKNSFYPVAYKFFDPYQFTYW
ncbi:MULTISPECIES: glycoside hydrolase family 2 TIM barrel-domain containing protein [unclassified Chitinophaga]|uniref:glycoside hydrolase family 2 TIM barrel-domain containing protein n=1 Tax=unclassified Chitinophaga TaxID=2619133 RepID=UPI00300FA353